MTMDEVLSFYRHKQSNVAAAINITRNAVSRWYINDSIPYDRQCQLQIASKGKLKADLEHDKNEIKRRERSKVRTVYIYR